MIVERAAVASSALRTSGSVRSMRRSLGARNPVPFHRQASAPPCDRATDAGPTPIAGMAHWHDPAANGRSQTDGSQLMEQHRDLGLNLEPAAKLAAQARPRSGWESPPPCDRATDAGPTPIAGMAHWHDPAIGVG